MSEKLIVRYCSPTLAGLKTANMFTCPVNDEEKLLASMDRFNAMLGKKGLRLLVLRIKDKRALIYAYRPSMLKADLENPISRAILKERGYEEGSVANMLRELKQRLCSNEDFPHEIGLFLGYPPDDVRCFICDRNRGCKCVGCWRAYNDKAGAERTFARFKKCSEVYSKSMEEGNTLERLTVAL